MKPNTDKYRKRAYEEAKLILSSLEDQLGDSAKGYILRVTKSLIEAYQDGFGDAVSPPGVVRTKYDLHQLTKDFVYAMDSLICQEIRMSDLSHYVSGSAQPRMLRRIYMKALNLLTEASQHPVRFSKKWKADDIARMRRIITVYEFYLNRDYMPEQDSVGCLV